MTEFEEWLDGRAPRPPAEVAAAVRAATEAADPSGALHRALTGAAAGALDRVVARPGPVRASAFDLLAADALVTYACEAALEADDADGALRDVLAGIVTR